MNYGELQRKLEQFRDKLIAHRELWSRSLDSSVPDQPIRMVKPLKSKSARSRDC
jgi:hypothetical protein